MFKKHIIMEKLWAPWRIKYIRGKKKSKCIFCQAAEGKSPKQVVFRAGYSLCMLNIFPYNNGHLMVSPLKHKRDISSLNDAEALDLFKALERAKRLLDKALKPDGYNIGINISSSAGAGIAGHMHIHIVPRWRGDVNFMPVVYNTKVISQSLEALHKLLKNAE